ncbi:glycosyltransferase, partial [Enterococcus faecium]|nr:glycosyltransferase [Enterococcus faecium]
MSKVLISVHMGRHFTKFGQSDLETLLEMGHEVHIAANFRGSLDHYNDDRVVKHQIDFSRNPFSFNNIRAFIQMKSILMRENFSLVHTQSPSGGAITRLALNSCKDIINTKVIYTAHGFHFYKGASWIAWNLFFPIEKHLSKNTDLCITINEEDYVLARTKMFFNK